MAWDDLFRGGGDDAERVQRELAAAAERAEMFREKYLSLLLGMSRAGAYDVIKPKDLAAIAKTTTYSRACTSDAAMRGGYLIRLAEYLREVGAQWYPIGSPLPPPGEGQVEVWGFFKILPDRELEVVGNLTDNPFAAERNTPPDVLPQHGYVGRILVPESEVTWQLDTTSPFASRIAFVAEKWREPNLIQVPSATEKLGPGPIVAKVPVLDGRTVDGKPLEVTIAQFQLSVYVPSEFTLSFWLRKDPDVVEIVSPTELLPGDDALAGFDVFSFSIESARASADDFAGWSIAGIMPGMRKNMHNGLLVLQGHDAMGMRPEVVSASLAAAGLSPGRTAT